ncbi:MAG: LysM peptidoglycan-binding domain-containing protein [Nitriliruptoraceae bacterium]|nr:LysM peptidoglycan-binding domain-containing protein [Nitriliruptoraceae bacterium]
MLPLLLWIAGLAVGTVLFHLLGRGVLAAPPLDPAGAAAWLDERDPLTATIAVLRLLVLALAWYLVGVTSIGLLARALRAVRLVRLADALTVPLVRRLLQQALGLSLAASMVAGVTPNGPGVGAGSGALGSDAPTAVTMVPITDTDGSPDDRVDGPAGGREATLVHLGAEDPPADHVSEAARGEASALPLDVARGMLAERRAAQSAEEGADAGADHVAVDAVAADEHEVQAGESLWSIAADALDGAGRSTDDTAVTRYWERLIAANRAQLADPDNPDLIFPGQRMVLPAVDGADT